jgi:adenylate kinase family enzyme
MTQQVFIFIGRSGCGKGTQAKLLMDHLKANDKSRESLYIQTGAELREFIKGDSITQKICKQIYTNGGLQPEFLAVYTWIKLLVDRYTGNEHIIFDGTPRKFHEAGVIDSTIDFYKFGTPHVINIDISHEEAKKRLMARGRMDDDEKDIEKRLSWYNTDVAPAIEFFQENSRYHFHRIDGQQSVDGVTKDIMSSLGAVGLNI